MSDPERATGPEQTAGGAERPPESPAEGTRAAGEGSTSPVSRPEPEHVDELRAPQEVRALLLDHAVACAPAEACGLVLVEPAFGWALAFVPCPNVAPAPARAFELEPAALALAQLLELAGLLRVATFHSHVEGPAYPSNGDLARGRAGELHLILSLETRELRAYRFDGHDDERQRTRLRAAELRVVTLPYTAGRA